MSDQDLLQDLKSLSYVEISQTLGRKIILGKPYLVVSSSELADRFFYNIDDNIVQEITNYLSGVTQFYIADINA